MNVRSISQIRAYLETGAGKRRMAGYAWMLLLILPALLVLVPGAQALEPAWNYSKPGGEIGGVAVSPNGDLIAVGAGKVLFFSRDGTLLAQEPFGNDVRMTSDGKYTASVYSSTVYYFRNPLPAGSPDQQKATKLWDKELSDQISSFDMNRDGSLIAGQTVGKKLFAMNTKTRVTGGNTKIIDLVIKISEGGIIGMSEGKIHSYSTSGTLIRTDNMPTNSVPEFLALPSPGSAVFSDGHTIHWVNNIYDGKERWRRPVRGSVTALLMPPSGSFIIAGTDAGIIARLNANGNFSWNYSSNPENRQGAWITSCALSDKATTIAAGTADGKILILNSQGELTGSYDAHENIRHIAVSADGSVVVAASDERVYVFAPGSPPRITPTPSRTGTPVKNTPAAPPVQTSVVPTTGSVASSESTTMATPTEVPTTYSVIRTATRSPPASITLLVAFAMAVVICGRRR